MTTIHMETDAVMSLAQQMIQSVGDMQTDLDNLSIRSISMDWLGSDHTSFMWDLDNILITLRNQVNAAQYLAERAMREVEEWELIASTMQQTTSNDYNWDFWDVISAGLDFLPYAAVLPFIRPGQTYLGQLRIKGGHIQKWLTYGKISFPHARATILLKRLGNSPLSKILSAASVGLIYWEARSDYGKYGQDHMVAAFTTDMAVYLGISVVAKKMGVAGALIGSGLGPIGMVVGAGAGVTATGLTLSYAYETPLESVLPKTVGLLITSGTVIWGPYTPNVRDFYVNMTSEWVKTSDFGKRSIRDIVIHSVADII